MSRLDPALRALRQLDDPALLGVVLLSVLVAAIGFVLLGIAVWYGAHLLLAPVLIGWTAPASGVLPGLLSGLLGALGAALLAHYLFLPVAGAVASLFCDPIAAAVERRHYPGPAASAPASLLDQLLDGLGLGARVLLLQLLALVLTPLLPGISMLVAYAATAWAIGRGLFVAVAMRHMDRRHAVALYRTRRPDVLLQGALAVAASLIPILNLLVPVLTVAALVHVLHQPSRAATGLARSRTV
jgi:uncharacterized protein involved in cysteine biosynthesis